MKKRSERREPNRESGFTLLELTIALAVIATLSVGYIQWKQSVLRDANAQRTADGIVLIEEALYNYRLTPRPTPVDPDFPYEWPATLAALDSYLPGIATARNGVGQLYSLIPPSPPVQRTTPIRIRTDLLTAERAEDVRQLFPLNGRTTPPDTWLEVIVPVPGHEAAREAMLARDGAKEMLGDLDMGNNNITGVDDEVTIGGKSLNTDDVDLLNQMSALNCTNAIQINGGVAQCAPPPECRVCYEVTRNPNGQCWPAPGHVHCSGWSGADDPAWTAPLADDTDSRPGWCEYQYRVECR